MIQYGNFGGNFKLMLTNIKIYYLNKAVICKYGGSSGNFKPIIMNTYYWFDVNKGAILICLLTWRLARQY
jgi:hypothetical protein